MCFVQSTRGDVQYFVSPQIDEEEFEVPKVAKKKSKKDPVVTGPVFEAMTIEVTSEPWRMSMGATWGLWAILMTYFHGYWPSVYIISWFFDAPEEAKRRFCCKKNKDLHEVVALNNRIGPKSD